MAKVLLVTGGSRGIGAAICRLGARDGYDVAINYAGRADAAEAVADEVRAAGRRAITIKADINDEAAVASMFDQVRRELGPVEAFVSNAGVIHKAAPLADLAVAEIRRVVEVDLTAHLICCREAVRRMSTKRGGQGGAIVLISSMASELYGARRLSSLRRRQGRHRRADDGPRQGGGGRGDPGHRPAARADRHRDPGRHRDREPDRPLRTDRADRSRGHGRRGRRGRPVAAVGSRRPTSRPPCSTSPAGAEERSAWTNI